MDWQVYQYQDSSEVPVGRPTTWDKAQRKYERLSAKNPNNRYAIGKA